MKRYVEVPGGALRAELREIGEAIAAKGGAWRAGHQRDEVVYTYDLPASPVQIKVYTSLALGDASARACGEDAVRLVLGCVLPGGAFRPLAKSRKLLRTAPQGEPEARVASFLARLREALRELYVQGKAIPACPRCSGPMAERTSARGAFYGCLGYPECRGTVDAAARPKVA